MIERAELVCSRCHHCQVCGPGAMLDWLRGVGMARRDKEPAIELIAELFRASAAKFTCPQCGASGLTVRPVADEHDEDWGGSRKCEACGQPIAKERVQSLPDVQLCAKCQSREERGEGAGSGEYCPRCGTPMVVRPTRGPGVTRYAAKCPTCRGH